MSEPCQYCLQPGCQETCPDKDEWDETVRLVQAINAVFPEIAERLREKREKKNE